MRKASIRWRIKNYLSKRYLGDLIGVLLAKITPKLTRGRVMAFIGTTRAVLFPKDGEPVDYGILAHRVVTDDFAALLVDHLHGGATLGGNTFIYHAAGTDNTAENAADTDLGAEVARVAGTSTEASAKVYKTVGTINFTGSYSIVEHGVFNGDTTAARILMDRSVFSAINVENGDSIQFTYQLTVNSGG